MKHLYYGDNLHVLRNYIAIDSVDLIYLDPPFNSKRDYNLLFKSPIGHKSEAQIEAFGRRKGRAFHIDIFVKMATQRNGLRSPTHGHELLPAQEILLPIGSRFFPSLPISNRVKRDSQSIIVPSQLANW